jgi:hypothetical protein
VNVFGHSARPKSDWDGKPLSLSKQDGDRCKNNVLCAVNAGEIFDGEKRFLRVQVSWTIEPFELQIQDLS